MQSSLSDQREKIEIEKLVEQLKHDENTADQNLITFQKEIEDFNKKSNMEKQLFIRKNENASHEIFQIEKKGNDTDRIELFLNIIILNF